MGLLVNGVWQDQWYDTKSTGGRFVRHDSVFRNWVTADGGKGLSGEDGFKAEPGRYHLYVSYACPWAHRTLIIATHRMSVLSLVNRIIVVDNGRIVVDDTKENAIARLSKPQKAPQ